MNTSNSQSDWIHILSKAIAAINDPTSIEPRDPIRRRQSLIRIWEIPSFDTATCWVVFAPGPLRPGFLGRRIVWDQKRDIEDCGNPINLAQRTHTINPTLLVKDIAIPAEDSLHQIVAEGRTLKFAPFINKPIGLDGTTYGVELSDMEVSWWCDGPKEWNQLISWWQSVRDRLETLLKHSKN